MCNIQIDPRVRTSKRLRWTWSIWNVCWGDGFIFSEQPCKYLTFFFFYNSQHNAVSPRCRQTRLCFTVVSPSCLPVQGVACPPHPPASWLATGLTLSHSLTCWWKPPTTTFARLRVIPPATATSTTTSSTRWLSHRYTSNSSPPFDKVSIVGFDTSVIVFFFPPSL